MAKAELGTKRACQSCGARFYDLGRDPAPCPKCGFENSLEALLRAKRPRAAPVEAKPKPKPPAKRGGEEGGEEEDVPLNGEGEDEEEELIEDASELGEDEEDVSDVLENADGDSDNDER